MNPTPEDYAKALRLLDSILQPHMIGKLAATGTRDDYAQIQAALNILLASTPQPPQE